MAKSCKKGYYYCYTSKKCKKIPKGWHLMSSTGRIMKDSEHKEEEETKKNGNGANGNGSGNGDSSGSSDGGGVSEGWSSKYKRSIDCDNPKGFSQRAHCQGRKKVNEAKEKGDHEVSMAQSQLKKSEENIRKLRKALGKKERNIPAWVQAKITDTEHNTDAASSYMDEGKRDGKSAKDKDYSLRDWFAGGGWVQTGGKYDGKPCAKQPGQKTKPFCRDADDRASMSKGERERRAKKKRREDPNPNRKGKAKNVTEVYDTRGTKYKGDAIKALEDTKEFKQQGGKVVRPAPVKLANSYSYSNWRQDLQDIHEIPLIPLAIGAGAAAIGGGMMLGKKMDKFVKNQRKTKPSDYAVKTGLGAYAAKARNAGLDTQSFKPEGEPIDEKCWDGYTQKGMKKKGKKVVPNCVPVTEGSQYKVGDTIPHSATKPQPKKTKFNVDKTGLEGPENPLKEGKKDACYKKVKARYDVWPSAYASGALVKCRKVGAANWGNKTKNEGYEFSNWRDDFQALEFETVNIIEAKPLKDKKKKVKRWWDDDGDGIGWEKGEVKEDWQSVNKKDKTDGMSQKAVNAYKRENPGSELKTAVTEKNPGGKRAKRRKSFCARSNGQRKMHNIDCSKTPDKAICKARKRWRC